MGTAVRTVIDRSDRSDRSELSRTKRSLATATAAVLVAAGLSLLAPSASSDPSGPPPPAPPAAARKAGNLSISPNHYYGGQGLVFSGNIGKLGKTRIWLEFHMDRPGDQWTKIEGSNRTTKANGSFRFVFPARGMENIKIRVAAKGRTTKQLNFEADPQVAHLSVRSPLSGTPYIDYVVTANDEFDFDVDTTRGRLRKAPVLAGRDVTLQRLTGQNGWSTQWSTVATGSLNNQGEASFEAVAPGNGQTDVYRVRLGEWKKNGSKIGWFPSFPVEITGGGGGGRLIAPAPATEVLPAFAPRTLAARGPTSEAFTRYGWSPAVFDFGFEYGESLSDPPFRGKKSKGKWLEYTNGSGRIAKHNGGMMMMSKYGLVGPNDAKPKGDHGEMAMTMTGNARPTGRWEMRIRPWTAEKGDADYRVRAELVPQKYGQYQCGANSIVIADFTPNENEVRFGAYSAKGKRSWTGVKKGVKVYATPNAYAVEVGKKHITWFVNGQPVGNVKTKAAIPGVPLALRLSMVGDGNKEMDHTYAIMDWIRGWDMARGRQVKGGPKMKSGKHNLSC